MRAVAIIACRMGSSRLPGKTAMPILGKPMIEHMVERVRRARSVDDVVLATSRLAEDERVEQFAGALGVGCYRGSPDDVLERITQAARDAGADLVVELLGDNPLVHSELIDDTVAFYRGRSLDYAATVTTEYPHAGPELAKFPVGIRVQVFPLATLERCEREAVTPYHRENSTTYIYEHPDLFRLGYLEATGRWARLKRPELTFAVNYSKNLELVRRIFERCYPRDPNFSVVDAVETFDADASLKALMGGLA